MFIRDSEVEGAEDSVTPREELPQDLSDQKLRAQVPGLPATPTKEANPSSDDKTEAKTAQEA